MVMKTTVLKTGHSQDAVDRYIKHYTQVKKLIRKGMDEESNKKISKNYQATNVVIVNKFVIPEIVGNQSFRYFGGLMKTFIIFVFISLNIFSQQQIDITWPTLTDSPW